jgi:hypothetical protein
MERSAPIRRHTDKGFSIKRRALRRTDCVRIPPRLLLQVLGTMPQVRGLSSFVLNLFRIGGSKGIPLDRALSLEASIVLGRDVSGGRTAVYEDLVGRILSLPLSWAPKHGIDRANFARLRRKPRAKRLPRGHGARLMARIQKILSSEG